MSKAIKIIGLFVVVFLGIAINKYFGASDVGVMVGATIGVGAYLILFNE